jgi:prevent-host-death family protein
MLQLHYNPFQDSAISVWKVNMTKVTMTDATVSIGQVKRDISELVNRVAYGHERIVLTSRGKPKAVLVSIEDYEQLRKVNQAEYVQRWRQWLADAQHLAQAILADRSGQPLDYDLIWQAARTELEERDEQRLNSATSGR